MIRRLSGILSVTTLPNRTPSAEAHFAPYQELAPSDAFHQAMDEAFDEVTDRTDLEHDEKLERPFWLFVDGAIGDARVAVVLLPCYGGPQSQEAIHRADDQHITYSEVLVVGVAGRLARRRRVAIGDVVVSTAVYDVRLGKAVTASKGKYSFAKPNPWQTPAWTDFDCRGWSPNAYIDKPSGEKYATWPGFREVHFGAVASGSLVSKTEVYARAIRDRFPECIAIDMESAGCCTALGGDTATIPVRMVKGLCDNADFRKSPEWHPYCADVAAALAADYIAASIVID